MGAQRTWTNWFLKNFDHNGSAADMDELTISNPSSNFTTSTDKKETWEFGFRGSVLSVPIRAIRG
jgi:hypothetical protein